MSFCFYDSVNHTHPGSVWCLLLEHSATCGVLVKAGSLEVPGSRLCLWILVAKAWWDPVLGLHVVLQDRDGRGLRWFWFQQGLEHAALCIHSHVPHFKTVCKGKCNRQKSRSREGSAWWGPRPVEGRTPGLSRVQQRSCTCESSRPSIGPLTSLGAEPTEVKIPVPLLRCVCDDQWLTGTWCVYWLGLRSRLWLHLPGSRSLWVSGSGGEWVLGRLGLAGGTGGGCAAERGAGWAPVVIGGLGSLGCVQSCLVTPRRASIELRALRPVPPTHLYRLGLKTPYSSHQTREKTEKSGLEARDQNNSY